MFTLNFKKEFAPAVEAGTKMQTIRAPRKDGKKPKAGDHLRLYTGLRTKGCRMLMDATCIGVEPIQIIDEFSDIAIVLAGERLTFEEGKALAQADGFNTRAEFVGFFLETHGLPFDGFRILWRPKPSNDDVTGLAPRKDDK